MKKIINDYLKLNKLYLKILNCIFQFPKKYIISTIGYIIVVFLFNLPFEKYQFVYCSGLKPSLGDYFFTNIYNGTNLGEVFGFFLLLSFASFGVSVCFNKIIFKKPILPENFIIDKIYNQLQNLENKILENDSILRQLFEKKNLKTTQDLEILKTQLDNTITNLGIRQNVVNKNIMAEKKNILSLGEKVDVLVDKQQKLTDGIIEFNTSQKLVYKELLKMNTGLGDFNTSISNDLVKVSDGQDQLKTVFNEVCLEITQSNKEIQKQQLEILKHSFVYRTSDIKNKELPKIFAYERSEFTHRSIDYLRSIKKSFIENPWDL
jgi:hypothetical protein